LKRCSMVEMRWNKYEVSLTSPVSTQIRRPTSEIKFTVSIGSRDNVIITHVLISVTLSTKTLHGHLT